LLITVLAAVVACVHANVVVQQPQQRRLCSLPAGANLVSNSNIVLLASFVTATKL